LILKVELLAELVGLCDRIERANVLGVVVEGMLLSMSIGKVEIRSGITSIVANPKFFIDASGTFTLA
jgi:hypothetical protein